MNAALQAVWQSRFRPELLKFGAMFGAGVLVSAIAIALALTSRAKARSENLQEQGVAASAAQPGAGAEFETGLPQRIAATERLKQRASVMPLIACSGWIAAVRILDALHPIAYTVEAGVAAPQAAADSLQLRYQEIGLEAPPFERNDLLLTIQGLHEDELVTAIGKIAAQGGGVVPAQRCKLARRPDGAGLDVDCTLRSYRLRQATVVAPVEPPS